MKKLDKTKHKKKMMKLRRKMLKAWALKKSKKATKLRQKIIAKTLKFNSEKE